MSVIDAIGNTSMVRLRKVVPPDCADIFVKLEWENPTGSMKDRMAGAVITRAEADGRLKPGGTVVEYTGGSTGASLALGGGAPGPHKIEGVGVGFVPGLWDPSLADEIVAVKTEDARAMTRRLAREEALFAGTSSGANVIATIRVGQKLGPGKTVVTLMCDSGLKYLNTDVFRTG